MDKRSQKELSTAVILSIMRDSGIDVRIANDDETRAVLSGFTRQEVMKMTAWHGSGMLFDHFDNSHNGQGEGGSSHGWGTYVAVSRPVSEAYARYAFANKEYHLREAVKHQRTVISSLDAQILSAEDWSSISYVDFKDYFLKSPDNCLEALRAVYGSAEAADIEGIAYTRPLAEQFDESSIKNLYPKFLESQRDGVDILRHRKEEAERNLHDAESQLSHSGKILYSVDIPDLSLHDHDGSLRYLHYGDDGNQFLDAVNNALAEYGETPVALERGKDGSVSLPAVAIALRNRFQSRSDLKDFVNSIGYDGWFVPHYRTYLEEQAAVIPSDLERIVSRLQKELIDQEPYNGDWEYISEEMESFAAKHGSGTYGEIYEGLSELLGNDRNASVFLSGCGYKGMHYSGGDDGEFFVVFNDSDVKINSATRLLQTSNGILYGWQTGNTIFLTEEGLNPETPIHEYTHLWARAMMKRNKQGWNSVKTLLKDTPVWNEVIEDEDYQDIATDEDKTASEVLARISGIENSRRIEEIVGRQLREGGIPDESLSKSFVSRIREALRLFWSWVGENLFDISHFKSVDDITSRVLYDLAEGTDLSIPLEEGATEEQSLAMYKRRPTVMDRNVRSQPSLFDFSFNTPDPAVETSAIVSKPSLSAQQGTTSTVPDLQGARSASSRQPSESPQSLFNEPDGVEYRKKKIEDTGEKIAGARKDTYQSFLDIYRKEMSMSDEQLKDRVSTLSKSRIFKFDFARMRKLGIPNEVVSFIKLVKDSIPNKPKERSRVEGWAKRTAQLYRFCLNVQGNWNLVDESLERMKEDIDGQFYDRYNTYMSVGGYDGGKEIGDALLRYNKDNDGVYESRRNPITGKWENVDVTGKWTLTHDYHFHTYDTREEAVEALKAYSDLLSQSKEEKKKVNDNDVQLVVWHNYHGDRWISPKGRKGIVLKSGFKDAKEAFAYIHEHNIEIQQAYADFKQKGYVELDWQRGDDGWFICPKRKKDIVLEGGFKDSREAFNYILNHKDELEDNYVSFKQSGYVELDLQKTDEGWYICPKGKEDVVLKDGFTTQAEASSYRTVYNADLQREYLMLIDSGKVDFGENRPRQGKDIRSGHDVSQDEFMHAFGFRGVQFGNWMINDQPAAQKALNSCYDALMDLSLVLGVSPKALSLGGRLGMAFGARGVGRFNAHYESMEEVINLTKMRGAGSLAHEWFHAVDNYFGKMGDGSGVDDFATSDTEYSHTLTPKDFIRLDDGNAYYHGKIIAKEEADAAMKSYPRETVSEAWRYLVKAINESAYGRRSKAYAAMHTSYWKEPTEMGARAFSVYVENELGKRGIVDDYLCNNPHLEESKLDAESLKTTPYPFDTDRKWMEKSFGSLFRTIMENDDHVLYQLADDRQDIHPLSEEERQLRDTLIGIFRASGIEVIVDVVESQEVLESAENARLSIKSKKAPKTASLHSHSLNGVDHPTVVLSADGAKVLKRLDTLANEVTGLVKRQELNEANSRIKFFKTSKGEVYGFTADGKIYVDPDIATVETPIHEYTHLWAEALRIGNPKEWENIKNLMRGTAEWNEIAGSSQYSHLANDDEIADEVLATYSGREGAKKLREKMELLNREGKDTSILSRLQEAIRRFWSAVADMFHVHFERKEDIPDQIMRDILNGVNPMELLRAQYEQKVQDIIDKSKKDGTYLLAPNGQKSNLGKWQWAVVRLPEFKEWFGDWEKLYRLKKLENSIPVAITGFEVPFDNDLKQYKKNALEYGKKLRDTYINNDTGISISLTGGNKRGGIREILQHDYKDIEHLQSIAAIPQIIRDSIYIDTLENEDINLYPNVKRFHYYVCGLKINGTDYTVKAVIAEQANGERYYDHKLTQIEKGKLLSLIPTIQKAGSDNSKPLLSEYKDTRLFSVLQTNSSKILDKNGEPLLMYHGTPLSRDDYERTTKGTGWQRDGSYVPQRAPFHTFHGGAYGGLIFLTSDYDVAHSVATERAMHIPDDDKGNEQWTEDGYVFDTFINVRNPFSADKDGEKILSLLKDEEIKAINFYLGGEETVSRDDAKSILHGDNSWEVIETSSFQGKIRELGYDGIIGKDRGEEYVAVMNPGQIKSASGNIGTYRSYTKDIRYQFAGIKGMQNLGNSSSADYPKALSVAEKMLKCGKGAHDIKLATGWELGVDGKWRYELPDADIDMSKFDFDSREYPTGRYFRLPQLLNGDYADELFKAYPELKDIRVRISLYSKDKYGDYDSQTKTISLNHAYSAVELRSTLLHEIQHIIQGIEGFAQGGNPSQMEEYVKEKQKEYHQANSEWNGKMREVYSRITDYYNSLKASHPSASGKELQSIAMSDSNYTSLQEEWHAIRGSEPSPPLSDAYKAYMSLAGEVESRNVETRLGMTEEQRRTSVAADTADVKAREQILYGVDGIRKGVGDDRKNGNSYTLSSAEFNGEHLSVAKAQPLYENNEKKSSFSNETMSDGNRTNSEQEQLSRASILRMLTLAKSSNGMFLNPTGETTYLNEGQHPFDMLMSQSSKDESRKITLKEILQAYGNLEERHPHAVILLEGSGKLEAYDDSARKIESVSGIPSRRRLVGGKVHPYVSVPENLASSLIASLTSHRQEIHLTSSDGARLLLNSNHADSKDIFKKADEVIEAAAKREGMKLEPLLRDRPSYYDKESGTLSFHKYSGQRAGGLDITEASSHVNDVYRSLVGALHDKKSIPLADSNDSLVEKKMTESLVRDLSAGVLMLRHGLPASLSKESLGNLDYYDYRIRNDGDYVNVIRRAVDSTIGVVLGDLKSRSKEETEAVSRQERKQLREYFIADKLQGMTDGLTGNIVIVKAKDGNSADVLVSYRGRGLEDMSRYQAAISERLQERGIDTVSFYGGGNPPYNKKNVYFEGREAAVSRFAMSEENSLNGRLVNIKPVNIEKIGRKLLVPALKPLSMTTGWDGKYYFVIHPEGEKGFCVPADNKEERDIYYNSIKDANMSKIHNDLGKRIYSETSGVPSLRIPVSDVIMPQSLVSSLESVNVERARIGKDHDDVSKAYIEAVVDGRLMRSRIDRQMLSKMYNADDKREYVSWLATKILGSKLASEKASVLGKGKENDIGINDEAVKVEPSVAAEREHNQDSIPSLHFRMR